MSAAVADPSGRPPAVADQCDPRTTIVFEPTETLMIQRWDKRRQKNLFVARPEASGDFDQREIDRWLLDAPSNEPPPEWRPRPSEPAPDPGVRSLMPPDWPTHRSEVAYESWSTIGGDTVHRIKRHGPGAAPPGVDVAPSKPPPSPIRLTARGDLVSGDRLRLTTAEDTARAHLRDHHIPISAHEFIVRRRPRERPTTAPATRGAPASATSTSGSAAVRLTHGRAPGVGWRGPHFAAPSRDPTTGLPASATSLEDAADPSRRRYGVAADIRERAGSACQETSRASGPPDASAPASARSTFRRKEAPKYTDAASFHASQRATARATGRWDASTAIRPATARPAATTTRLTPGEGRGGGGLPTAAAAPGSATAARAARRASARAGSHFGGRTTTVLSRPATATARGKKTVAFPDTREGRERVAAAAAGTGTDEPRAGDGDGDGDGFGAQERVSMEAHMERLRSLGASLNPRQRTMVGRGMEKARERIRHERSWGG